MLFIYFKYWTRYQSRELNRSLFPLRRITLQARQEDICSICLQVMNSENRIAMIKRCGHTYHLNCIEEWLSLKDMCPICRAIV